MTTRDSEGPAAVEAPEEVVSLLREQAERYARLESLALRQRSLVTNDDVEPLLSLLADRQKLAEELAELADRLAPIRRAWSAYRQRLTASQRTEAERLLSEMRERLSRLIASDEQDARVLSGRKETVAEAMRSTHSTGQALSAYRAPAAAPHRLDCVDQGA